LLDQLNVSSQPDLRQLLADLSRLSKTRPDQALDQAEAILKNAPGLVPMLCLAGHLARRTGDLERARTHLETALKHDPNASPALAEMGTLASTRGEYEVAARCFRKMLDQGNKHADVWFNLALAQENLGSIVAAADSYHRALEAGAVNAAEIRARRGGVLAMSGQESAARAEYEQALALDPESIAAHLGAGMMALADGDFEGARASFRRCVSLDPYCAEAWQQLIEAGQVGDPEDGDLRQVRELLSDPGVPAESRERLGFALGKACDDLGLYTEAFEHYRQANELKRRRLPAFDRRAWASEVDRLIATAADEKPCASSQAEIVPIFIVGMPRSGTTLVDQILTCHPDADGIGEVPFLDRVRNDDDSIRSNYLERLATTGARTVTNKYPANFRHLPTLRRLFPEARIIHVVRDPLDTCLSIYFQDFPSGNLYANDLQDIAAYYAGYRRLIDTWAGRGSGVLRVGYESMLDDLEKVAHSLLAYCGLSWDPACLEFERNPRPVDTLSRWQVRQPLYHSSAGRWRHYQDQLQPLVEALGPLSR
jgi:tetratricopeptide (TPR) repeat protein